MRERPGGNRSMEQFASQCISVLATLVNRKAMLRSSRSIRANFVWSAFVLQLLRLVSRQLDTKQEVKVRTKYFTSLVAWVISQLPY